MDENYFNKRDSGKSDDFNENILREGDCIFAVND